MKFLLTVTPGPTEPPPEVFAKVMPAARDFLHTETMAGRIESLFAYVEGGGVCIVNAESVEELQRRMLDYPLAMWMHYEVRPLVDIDQAFDNLTRALTATQERVGTGS